MERELVAFNIAGACRALGIGRTSLYRILAIPGALDAKKLGRRTVISAESLRRYRDNLPSATFKGRVL